MLEYNVLLRKKEWKLVDLRIAVIDRDKCTREMCGWQCIKACPVNRMGQECIVQDGERWPVISEALCTGCGICPKKCPVKCIKIINLVEERGTPIHQYGVNSFRLYGLPLPKQGAVVGLVGPNGIGKTTALQLLSGSVPNFGNYGNPPNGLADVVSALRGKQELHNYYTTLEEGKARIAHKPQGVDRIPEVFKGTVKGLLSKADGRGMMAEAVGLFRLGGILDREVGKLSGGELQRVAICAAYLRDADLYYFDEPTSYLDIKQRMRAAHLLRELADSQGKAVMVVEHDLAILDYLSEYVHVFFGENGAFGVVSRLKGVRNGINEYLDGYLSEENIRIREYSIKFEAGASEGERKSAPLFSYPALAKKYAGFSLTCDAGEVKSGEIIGIVGENAVGKTTFVRMLAGAESPDQGDAPHKMKISYKPQYIRSDFSGTVADMLASSKINRETFENDVKRRMGIGELMEKEVKLLSGGELQRLAVALAISEDADLYLLDEPSAFLDIEQRLNFAELLKRVIGRSGKAAFVVDHDIVLIDAVSSRLMVFEGEGSVSGHAGAPEGKRDGMNRFLKEMDITLRRDKDSKRPRVNKHGSVMDREQKAAGEYYYHA